MGNIRGGVIGYTFGGLNMGVVKQLLAVQLQVSQA
jgi:hypothetical protein